MEEVDKLMVEDTLVHLTTSLSPPQTSVSSPNSEPLNNPKVIQQASQQMTQPNDYVKNVKKLIGKRFKSNIDINFKNKRDGRLISWSLRNKTNSHANAINMIEVNEISDSKIDKFLAEEDPLSFEPHPDRPYNFVDNLPPCLKDNLEFPGVKLCNEPIICLVGAPVHNLVCSNANTT